MIRSRWFRPCSGRYRPVCTAAPCRFRLLRLAAPIAVAIASAALQPTTIRHVNP
ncbi:hypothetical protein [Lysobacter gummosus]|uniref:hypothetical protein n=1 Tax=Lysobacter gummosus TaxID=262324 RepID=UPI00071EB7D6|nr:hypothetical protein LG3211_0443 [Lysobacter gummosus]